MSRLYGSIADGNEMKEVNRPDKYNEFEGSEHWTTADARRYIIERHVLQEPKYFTRAQWGILCAAANDEGLPINYSAVRGWLNEMGARIDATTLRQAFRELVESGHLTQTAYAPAVYKRGPDPHGYTLTVKGRSAVYAAPNLGDGIREFRSVSEAFDGYKEYRVANGQSR